MAATNNQPVMIIGAGPTGMTAAMELNRLGIPLRIVDKLATPSTTSRALAVQPRTLELFAQRGLTEEMLEIGNPAHAATIYGDSQQLGKVPLNEIKSRYNYILLLSQAETERILREHLSQRGISIERGTEAIAIAQETSASSDTGSVSVTLRKPDGTLEEVEAAYLIAAEGAHSMTRHTLNVPFAGQSMHESYALADLHVDGDLPEDELSIFAAAKGLLAVFPMGNRHFRFIASEPEDDRRTGDPDLEELQQLYDKNAFLPARLYDMTWSSRFHINSRMLKNLRERRIFFGGDSAHIHSPAGGQGMNTGIQDMINLCWKLAMVYRGTASPDLLDTYEQDRIPIIHSVVSTTERATAALISDSSIVHQLITHLAPPILGNHLFQLTGTGFISEIAAGYHDSKLSTTAYAPGTLRGGDRVPDLTVKISRDEKQVDVPLFSLLDPSGFVLLSTNFGQEGSTPTFSTESLAPWKNLLKTHQIQLDRGVAFGEEPGLYLVRPDGYLGFVGHADDPNALTDWLHRWMPPLV